MSAGNSSRKNPRRNLNQIYNKPLPVEVRPYPTVDFKDPKTWFSFLKEVVWPEPMAEPKPLSCSVITHGRMCVIRVDDQHDQLRLWREGFLERVFIVEVILRGMLVLPDDLILKKRVIFQ